MHIKQRYQNCNFYKTCVMIYLCEQKFEHSFEWKGAILNCIRGYKFHIKLFMFHSIYWLKETGK